MLFKKLNLPIAIAGAVAALASSSIAVSAVGDEEFNQGIEEIVVTSRRRDESVQDVPLSVTAFGQDAINKLKPTTLRDFDGLAPNVYIGMNASSPGGAAIFIRGVGYADVEKTQSPQVGVIVDGVQLGSSTGQLIDVFDVESIEINRGPQGVLFGKNSIGGNIVVNRVRPQFNDLGFAVSAEAGNYDSSILKGRVNIPLIDDQLALKVGMIQRERDGYYDNQTLGGSAGDIDYQSTTVALRWSPSETFDATLTWDKIDDTSQISPQDPRFDGANPHETLSDMREPLDYQVDQVSLRFDWDLSDTLTLHSISGWSDGEDLVQQDFDGATVNAQTAGFAQLHTQRDQEYEVFSQELRLSGEVNENLDFMVGVYYFDSELSFTQTSNNVIQIPGAPVGTLFDVDVPNVGTIQVPFLSCDFFEAAPAFAGIDFNNHPVAGSNLCQFQQRAQQFANEEVKSIAYFASMTWRPTEELELSLGVRNIDEEKRFDNAYFDRSNSTFDADNNIDPFNVAGRPTRAVSAIKNQDDWNETIIQASVNWQFADNMRTYLSYSEGFRSGGFSIRSARPVASQALYQPEDAFQYELGFKGDFFDRRLRLNVAYFYLEREDSQFNSVYNLLDIPGTTTVINNGNQSETQGLEVESQWLINDDFTLQINGGYLDFDEQEYFIACERVDGCGTDAAGTLRALGGSDESRQPEWNYAMNLAFDRQMGPGVFTATLGYKKVGDFVVTGIGQAAQVTEGGYDEWNATVAYEWELDSGDRLTISATGKNLGDSEWLEQALLLGGANTGFQGWGAPRTYALEVKYSR